MWCGRMGTTGLQLIADVSQKMSFAPQFEITNSITAELTSGFLDAAKLSADWIAGMQKRALVRELVAGELLFRPRFLIHLIALVRLLPASRASGRKLDAHA